VAGYRSLARNRDFTILWVGETVSELGTSLSLFAFPLVTYTHSGSTLVTSLVELAYLLGLCGVLLPAGLIADRVDRRRVMLCCSATGLVSFGSLAAAGVFGHLTVPHLAAVALVGGAAFGCMEPAMASATRTVVSTEDLPTALSQNQARQHVGSLVGGPLGGVLYAVTRWLPFAVDAATFAVSLLTVSRLRTDLSAPHRERRAPHRDLAEGFGFMWARPFFRVLLAWAAASNLVGNALFFVVTLRMIQQHHPPAQIGLVSTAAGLGGLVGAAMAPTLIQRLPTGALTVMIGWACCLPVVPLIWWSSPYAVAACTFVLLLLNPVGNAGIGAYRTAITPDALQGRVSSASQFTAMAVMPLSPVVGGLLLTHAGGRVSVLVLVLATAALALLLTGSRSIRAVPGPADWPRPAPEATSATT